MSLSSHSIKRLLVWLMMVGVFSACGEDRQSSTTVVRDSAGIAIVENQIDTAAARAGWAIDPGRRLADGRIVMADGGAAEIRVYGADGALVVAHGGKGEGPGEDYVLGLTRDELDVEQLTVWRLRRPE